MAEIQNTEDRNIRRFLIIASSVVALGLVSVAVTIGVTGRLQFQLP